MRQAVVGDNMFKLKTNTETYQISHLSSLPQLINTSPHIFVWICLKEETYIKMEEQGCKIKRDGNNTFKSKE